MYVQAIRRARTWIVRKSALSARGEVASNKDAPGSHGPA
jgi:hypothetical protein